MLLRALDQREHPEIACDYAFTDAHGGDYYILVIIHKYADRIEICSSYQDMTLVRDAYSGIALLERKPISWLKENASRSLEAHTKVVRIFSANLYTAQPNTISSDVGGDMYGYNSHGNVLQRRESLIACYYSEKLGFNLPESIIQIKLQYSKYEQLSNELRLMLEDYHLTIASFDTIELSFLQSYIDHIQIIIKPGTSRISFGKIDNFDYINECKKTIRQISLDIHEHLETFRFCIIDPIVSRHNDGITHGISQLPKHFVRWLRGTCISCPVIPVLDENLESPDFTFYNDVKQHLDVY
ncbi:unnamed protein product [Rotaria sp. Silwood2]|nr:unnamed protein product [Rotaria sp. Silwood2]